MFSIARKMGLSNTTAFLAGNFIVFDFLNLMECRYILVDSQLMFYCGLALWLALKFWERVNVTVRRSALCTHLCGGSAEVLRAVLCWLCRRPRAACPPPSGTCGACFSASHAAPLFPSSGPRWQRLP
jgi:hypothetical protein